MVSSVTPELAGLLPHHPRPEHFRQTYPHRCVLSRLVYSTVLVMYVGPEVPRLGIIRFDIILIPTGRSIGGVHRHHHVVRSPSNFLSLLRLHARLHVSLLHN